MDEFDRWEPLTPDRKLARLTLAVVGVVAGAFVWSKWPPLYAALVVGQYDPYELPSMVWNVLTVVLLLLLGGLAANQLWHEKRNAAALTLLAWMFSLSTGLILLAERFSRSFSWDFVSPVDIFLYDWKGALLALGGFGVLIVLARYFQKRSEPFGYESAALSEGRIKPDFLLKALGVGVLVWMALHLGALSYPVEAFSYVDWGPAGTVAVPIWDAVNWAIGTLGPHLEFWIPAAIILGWLTMECVVDEDGVVVLLRGLGVRIAGLRWSEVKVVRLLLHGNRPPSAILLPKGIRFWRRFSVHGRHYANGSEAVSQLLGLAEKEGIPVERYYSSPWVPALGYFAILAGWCLIRYEMHREITLGEWFLQDDFPLSRFDEFGAFVPLGAMTASSAALFGLGAGLLSAYHNASPRPFLLILLIAAVTSMPTPLLFWLVYFGIYAILLATPQPLVHLDTVKAPTPTEMMLGMNLVDWIPIFVGVGYLLGVWAGNRRARPGEEAVGVPSRLTPQPKTSAGAQQAG
ncbi:MAG: hypothetical protein KatS3mg015_0664 [Fimbriimonadales bacterium]|nr:MAG: hypothetical protein KatS3mg015_0664 [Fimbriimonadales bacterium]